MIPGPTLIIACPYCKGLFKCPSLEQETVWEGEYWSDGKKTLSGNCVLQDITYCIYCGHYYWLKESTLVGKILWRKESLIQEWLEAPVIPELCYEHYFDVLKKDLAVNEEEEISIRLQIWRLFNDLFRERRVISFSKTEEMKHIGNMVSLEMMLTENEIQSRILKAEVNRHLGNFTKSIGLLNDKIIRDSNWGRLVKQKAQEKETRVFSLNIKREVFQDKKNIAKQILAKMILPDYSEAREKLEEPWELSFENLRNKIALLRKLDRKRFFGIFGHKLDGAKKHQYVFEKVCQEHELIKFEIQNHIVLPADYRKFLLTVGNGGMGPKSGIFPLKNPHAQSDKVPLDFLKNPFRYLSAWNNDRAASRVEDYIINQRGTEDDLKREEKEYFNLIHVSGSIRLCCDENGISTLLVVSGSERGNIWTDARNVGKGIFPNSGLPNKKRITFLEWYTNWLDRSIEKIIFKKY